IMSIPPVAKKRSFSSKQRLLLFAGIPKILGGVTSSDTALILSSSYLTHVHYLVIRNLKVDV
ncbi:MAG: hypothetical protein RR491_01225, partial [Lachnospiraceae bacterium]